jgi:hypothetical protein
LRKDKELTQEYVKYRFSYDEKTGKLFFRNAGKPAYNGREVCSIDRHGYYRTMIEGKGKLVHRLVWLYVYGKMPLHNIDHINGVRTDNRIENLRDVSPRINSCNMVKHRNGKIVGVRYSKTRNKWIVRTTEKGRTIQVGVYDTELEAREAHELAITCCERGIELINVFPKRDKNLRNITWRKDSHLWCIQIVRNKKVIFQKYFADLEEAKQARDAYYKENDK